MTIGLAIVQLILLAVLALGDIGFDHPGRFGMSFGHGIVLSAFYLVVLLGGLVSSFCKRKWKAAILQLVIPLLGFVYLLWPAPHFNAQDHQQFLGQPRSEVERQLSSRNAVYGMQSFDGVETEFVSYDGMTIHYSSDNVVVRVESNDYNP